MSMWVTIYHLMHHECPEAVFLGARLLVLPQIVLERVQFEDSHVGPHRCAMWVIIHHLTYRKYPKAVFLSSRLLVLPQIVQT
jgi:hypothetical protein